MLDVVSMEKITWDVSKQLRKKYRPFTSTVVDENDTEWDRLITARENLIEQVN